jgi:hypothetical protein
MKFDFFDVPEDDLSTKEKPKKEKKKKKACPYCGELFISVNRHLPYCPQNPDMKKNKKDSVDRKEDNITKDQEIQEKIKKEIRKELLKSLDDDQVQKLELSPSEREIIEDVMQFMGGTEGYQFIYKALTGQKIRGKMTKIIDECIAWLQKHKLYILWHR